MTDRARIAALTTLVQSANSGGYTLPADVVEAHGTWQRLQQTELPSPRQFSSEDAASRIVAAASAGEPFDPVKLCADFHKAADDRRLHDEALRVMREAIDQAASIAVSVASDATERVISEHLRPAYVELMEQAREAATLLAAYTDGSHRLDLQGIVAATSSKVRTAYLSLPGLLERRRLILQARAKANIVGERKPEHDDGGLFAVFADPMAFFPGWKPPARIPLIPFPEDATAQLLWLTGPEATAAKPWLPTMAEQDAAWWGRFGEQVTQRRTNEHSARAMAAQAAGIERRDGSAEPAPAPVSATARRAATAARLFGTRAGVPVNGGAVTE